MAIKSIVVVGAGQMGCGIAQVAAQCGFEVVLQDLRMDLVEQAMALLRAKLEKRLAKAEITQAQLAATLERIRPETGLEAAAGADLVIEAATECLEVKTQIFQTLDEIAPVGVILASNTSALSITALGAATRRPAQVVGMHFMNPVPVMTLVEVVRGLETSEATLAEVTDLARRLDKTPVVVKDSPGFVSNRLLMPMINEAIYCLSEGVASPSDIDRVMRLGMNHPLGPLALADLIGLDTCLAIMEVLYRDFADSKYRPCPLLRQMVRAGRLGRKSGQGFYSYFDPSVPGEKRE
ncbi:3-hydroxybutyryl-CoA dehydrogenase [Geoalkalibacter halelectricus]|uniref:3-hydroxybutyryl-CoA dehydrogenase n=1 Tax=Geoalkalibacter halelectricus TaxID=2847045 RepID=UPI003D1FD773